MTPPHRALHQSFLPKLGKTRAFVWKYSPVNGGRRPRHFHAEPELNLVVSGSATFAVGEATVRLGPRDLVGFAPGQDHVLLDASPDLYLFAIGMDAAFSREVLGWKPDEAMLPFRAHLGADDFRAVVGRASAIVDREAVDQPCAELWEQAHWLRARREEPGRGMHVLTRWALAGLSRAPTVGLQGLCSQMHISPSEVSRYFHRDLGMTFVRYRTRLRLLRLIELMDRGGKTLASVAQESGFGSYSQCHRIFQTELACSPREFFASGVRQQMQDAYDP